MRKWPGRRAARPPPVIAASQTTCSGAAMTGPVTTARAGVGQEAPGRGEAGVGQHVVGTGEGRHRVPAPACALRPARAGGRRRSHRSRCPRRRRGRSPHGRGRSVPRWCRRATVGWASRPGRSHRGRHVATCPRRHSCMLLSPRAAPRPSVMAEPTAMARTGRTGKPGTHGLNRRNRLARRRSFVPSRPASLGHRPNGFACAPPERFHVPPPGRRMPCDEWRTKSPRNRAVASCTGVNNRRW